MTFLLVQPGKMSRSSLLVTRMPIPGSFYSGPIGLSISLKWAQFQGQILIRLSPSMATI